LRGKIIHKLIGHNNKGNSSGVGLQTTILFGLQITIILCTQLAADCCAFHKNKRTTSQQKEQNEVIRLDILFSLFTIVYVIEIQREGFSFVRRRGERMAKVKPHDATDRSSVYQPLLDTESSLMVFLAEPAITTITFFKGANSETSSAWLRARLTEICKANPWLAGRLVKNKKVHKNLLLEIPAIVSDEDVDSIICSDDNVISSLSKVSSKSKYDDLVKAILKSNAVVGPGYKLIGKRDCRIAKFTLVPVGNDEVALIASITHAVSDGYTYYKILSMLSGEIEELSCTRKHDFVSASIDAIGAKEYKFLNSTSFLICCLRSMLCGSKARIEARYTDEDKIISSKEKVKDGFVSTNDILTSAFARATKADLLLMAINLRNRVKGTDQYDAGNYESVLVHDSSSASTPLSLRKTLQGGAPFKRVGDTKLPGFLKTTRSKVALITNWSFPDIWKANLKLFDSSGAKSVPIELHLPVYNTADIAFPLGIIFKPNADRLAILYGGGERDISYDKLVEVGCPVAETVSTSMFPQS
jgi:hypothetical protein